MAFNVRSATQGHRGTIKFNLPTCSFHFWKLRPRAFYRSYIHANTNMVVTWADKLFWDNVHFDKKQHAHQVWWMPMLAQSKMGWRIHDFAPPSAVGRDGFLLPEGIIGDVERWREVGGLPHTPAVGECRGPQWAMSKPGLFPRYNYRFLSSLQLPVSFLVTTSDQNAMLPCADRCNGQRCMSDSAFQWLQFVLLDPSADISRHQWTCCAVTYFQGFNNNNNMHSNAPNPPMTIHLLG